MQIGVVRIQQAGVAALRQRHDVLVIRSTRSRFDECRRHPVDFTVIDVRSLTCIQLLLKPPLECVVRTKFFAQSAAHHQVNPGRIYPSEELDASLRTIWSEHLMNHIIIEDHAHDLQSDRSVGLIQEEPAIVRRSAQDVASLVQAKRVNANVKIAALEEENGHVVRCQLRGAIAHVHADAIEQVVAVCFDHQLSIASGYLAQQGSERRLSARVEMDLWLL